MIVVGLEHPDGAVEMVRFVRVIEVRHSLGHARRAEPKADEDHDRQRNEMRMAADRRKSAHVERSGRVGIALPVTGVI